MGTPGYQDEDDSAKTTADWSVKDVGKSWQFRFFYFVIRIGGLRPAYHIMYFVVLWYVLFVPEIRRRTQYYLRRRFPDHRNPLRRFWDSYRLVFTFSRTMIDRAAYALLGEDVIKATCEDEKAMRAALEGGDGVVMANAHVGCWELAMSSLSLIDRPVYAVIIPPEGNSAEAHLRRENMPVKVIDPREGPQSVLKMVQVLQEGCILGVMADRVFGRKEETVKARFLGDEVIFPFSPYRLASATGRPIVVLFSHKPRVNLYVVDLAEVIDVPPGVREPEDAEPHAQKLADALEKYVEKHPWQYFNFFDLWNNPFEHAENAATSR
ncbi:MAG: lipid A biosynthesis acyltransferase [Candidatus Brocadiia bacterium]